MKSIQVFSIALMLVSLGYSIPVFEEEPIESETISPILLPEDGKIEHNESEASVTKHEEGNFDEEMVEPTEFPILIPSDEDFVVLRPSPQDTEEVSSKESEAYQDEEDLNRPVERPYPVEKSKIVHKRDTSNPNEDDTVVIEAATCEELWENCHGKNDLLSCEAFADTCARNAEVENELKPMVNGTSNDEKDWLPFNARS